MSLLTYTSVLSYYPLFPLSALAYLLFKWLDFVGWWCWIFLKPWWFSVELFYQLLEEGFWISGYIWDDCGFVYMDFLISVLLAFVSHILQFCYSLHRHVGLLWLLHVLTLWLFHNVSKLYLLWVYVIWNIAFLLLLINVCMIHCFPSFYFQLAYIIIFALNLLETTCSWSGLESTLSIPVFN